MNGGRCAGTVELVEPVTVVLDYGERWIKSEIEPVELVTLRALGLTYGAIAERLGSTKGTVWRALRKSGCNGSFKK